jgi:hypothetical protein
MVSDCATCGLDQEVEGPKGGKFDRELAEEVAPCRLSPLHVQERTSLEVLSMEVTDNFSDDLRRENQRGAYKTSQMNRNRAKCPLRDLVEFCF